MHHSTLGALISLLAGIALCAPAQAQTMYRCGKTYQDRPCDNGQQGKVIGSSEAPRASPKSVADASCARRGEDAQKIVWAREGGALQDKLLAEARSGERRKLIADVYAIRGTTGEVRAAIEADCIAEKEMAAKAGMMGGDVPYPSRDTERKAAAASDADRKSENAVRAEQSAMRKRVCDGLKEQLAGNRESQRAGGGVETMERLNQQRRDTESELKTAGCDGAQRSMQMQ